MALFADNMLEIAVELAMTDEDYADMVLKFLEHDAWITSSLVQLGEGVGMWDEEDGFFYDVLRLPEARAAKAEGAVDGGTAAVMCGDGFRVETAGKVPRSRQTGSAGSWRPARN